MKRKTTKAGPTAHGSTSLGLPPPRPMSDNERDLYGLLVDDLTDAVERRVKAARRVDKLRLEVDTLQKRELVLRAQLGMFEPDLDGLGVVLSQFKPPPEQPGATQ